jgi:hypothetical protein
VRQGLSGSFDESDSRAGFYYDIKFIICLTYVLFFIITLLSGPIFSTGTNEVPSLLIFLSLSIFMDLQEFVEVKVPRHGWKCSKSNYKFACIFLTVGTLLVSIADYLINIGAVAELSTYQSILLFFLSMGFLAIPIIGMVLTLVCYLDFAHSLGISMWRRDKEIIEAISKHSFFYHKLSGIHKR